VALVDALGNLVCFLLLPGQTHDMKGVAPLIKDISFDARLADKAFDAGWLLQDLNARGAKAVIPPKANRTVQRAYDKVDVHVPTKNVSYYSDYKSHFVMSKDDGSWSHVRVKNEVARSQCMTRTEVLDVAARSLAICQGLDAIKTDTEVQTHQSILAKLA